MIRIASLLIVSVLFSMQALASNPCADPPGFTIPKAAWPSLYQPPLEGEAPSQDCIDCVSETIKRHQKLLEQMRKWVECLDCSSYLLRYHAADCGVGHNPGSCEDCKQRLWEQVQMQVWYSARTEIRQKCVDQNGAPCVELILWPLIPGVESHDICYNACLQVNPPYPSRGWIAPPPAGASQAELECYWNAILQLRYQLDLCCYIQGGQIGGGQFHCDQDLVDCLQNAHQQFEQDYETCFGIVYPTM